MKIQVLPPDVNESSANFTPVGNDIRFGLTAIRNVGAQRRRRRSSRRARRRAATTTSTTSWRRSPALVCNKRVIESLIKAGAFDDMKHQRRALVAIHEDAVDQYVDIKRNEAIGQDSLFGGARRRRRQRLRHLGDRSPSIDEWDKTTLLGHERDMLGLYVSDHPLLGLEHVLSQRHRLHHRPADARRGARRRQPGHHQRPGHLGAAQDHQARRRLGDGHPRGPRRRASRCCCSRAPTSSPAPCSSRTRSSRVKGALSREQGPARDHGPRRSPSPTSPTARPGRS